MCGIATTKQFKGKGCHSDRNVHCISNSIRDMNQTLKVQVSTEDEWFFREEVRPRVEQPLPQMVGWSEQVLVFFDSDHYRDNPVVQ